MILQNVEEREAHQNTKEKAEGTWEWRWIKLQFLWQQISWRRVTTGESVSSDSYRTPPVEMNVSSDRSQLRSSTGHMRVFCTILRRPPITAEVRVWSRARQCAICIGQSAVGIGLLLLLRISPVSIIPPIPDWNTFISHPRYTTLATDSVNE